MAPQWASANNERGNAIKNTATLPVRGSSFRTQCPPRLASNLPEKIARACLSGPLGDLWIFDLALSTWAELPTALGSPPGPRAFHGFASLGGLLYVHGGQVYSGARASARFLCVVVDGRWRVYSFIGSKASSSSVEDGRAQHRGGGAARPRGGRYRGARSGPRGKGSRRPRSGPDGPEAPCGGRLIFRDLLRMEDVWHMYLLTACILDCISPSLPTQLHRHS